MSLENNIASIAESLKIIATYLTATKTEQIATPVIQTTPVPVVAAHVVVASPAAAPVVAPSVMPAPPVFTAPVAVAPVVSAPVAAAPVFASKNEMMDFVLSSYKALGAEKGAKIQDVLVSIGYKNINDVPEAQWGQLKTGIEALK